MVHVDVEDRHALVRRAQLLRGDGHVVQVAEAVGAVCIRVVARRAAQRIGRTLALQHQLCRVRGHVGRAHGRCPGVRADGAGVVAHVVAGLPDHALRVGAGLSGEGMDVGHDLVGRVVEQAPARIGRLEEPQVLGRVDRGARAGAEVFARDDLVAVMLDRRQQAEGALGLLVAALQAAAHHEELRVVVLVGVAVDDLHRAGPCVGSG